MRQSGRMTKPKISEQQLFALVTKDWTREQKEYALQFLVAEQIADLRSLGRNQEADELEKKYGAKVS